MWERKIVLAGRVCTCCLCFCVWGYVSQYYTPVSFPKSAAERSLFSFARSSLNLPALLLVCILPNVQVEVWMIAHFLKRVIERQCFQACVKCIYLATCQPRGSVLRPMWLWRVIDKKGLSVRYFKHVLCFATHFHYWCAMHADAALS